ncbi:hypothetical protein V6N13_134883 [Hibiscus sabdariffa]|uniref:Uncharacterized protein n=1 Tax=Hibiscus sabdariffa TaxID=183260 RepID=A0ABR2R570_9ROSI
MERWIGGMEKHPAPSETSEEKSKSAAASWPESTDMMTAMVTSLTGGTGTDEQQQQLSFTQSAVRDQGTLYEHNNHLREIY